MLSFEIFLLNYLSSTNSISIASLALIIVGSSIGIFLIFFIFLCIFSDNFRKFFFYPLHFFLFKLLSFNPKPENKTKSFYFQEIENAIFYFSKNKIGCTIIFIQNNPLDKFFLYPGTQLDAVISEELLHNIFSYKRSNLHDGAVLIDRQLRLKSASVYLRLPSKGKFAGNLGTRHNAAKEISSKTDAIALIVSEKDGRISFYEQKREKRIMNSQNFRKYLKKL